MSVGQMIGSRVRVLFFPTIVLFAAIGWLAFDGYRMKAKQAAKYALPADISGPSLLEFLRQMDGAGNAPKSILESSNMEPICKAVVVAYDALRPNIDSLTDSEQREAEYYYLAYSALAITHGVTPCTDAAIGTLLEESRSFLIQATSFGTREREIMNRIMNLLEATGRIEDELQFVDALLRHLDESPGLASESTTRAVSTLTSIANRLNMMNKVLSLTSHTIDQKPFDIQDLRGKAVLIEFWGTRCIPCLQELPALKRIYQSNRERFEIVGICLTSEPARVENFVEEHDMTWTQLCDDRAIGWECNQRLAEQFGVLGVPASLLVDPNGVVVKIGVRPLSANKFLDLEECLNTVFKTRYP
jgi:thiol-disulfide isomerase/thioredoxin